MILLLIGLSFAAPAPPELGVNDTTKQCAQFFPGDECTVSSLPNGWRRVEFGACPQSYTEGIVNPIYYPQRSVFCCSKGHSGADGDCEDVVVNDQEKACAFVSDINSCQRLPEGWRRLQGRTCPSYSYQWRADLECEERGRNAGQD